MVPPAREAAPSAYDQPLLIRHLLSTPLALAPAQEIVYAGRHRMSYRDLRERIGRLASALQALGVGPGSTVAVMDWDSHRYLECFFAVPMMGAVLHTINVRLAPEQILYTINHARDDVLLVHADFMPVLERIRDRIETVRHVVALRDDTPGDAGPPAGASGEYEALLAAAAPDYPFADFDENTPATTFYTTGTTGDPKGVWYTHRQLVLHTLAVLAGTNAAGVHGSFTRRDVYMPLTPMFHVHAWGLPYVATVLGVKQVYPGRYVPEHLLGLIAREGVTFSHCVPTILHMLLESPAAATVDLSRWKVIIGGSAMPRGLAQRAMQRGIDVYSGYGMSETCPVLTCAHLWESDAARPPEEQLDLRCKTGQPLPLVDLRVVDPDMQDVPHDGASAGEVVVRCPWLTQGYVADPQRSAELWRGGWLHTGDVGSIDERGYLKIGDRLKDVIKSGGEWISSLTLEDLASAVPGVAEVAAIGVPDERWGERPLLLVVPAPGATVDAQAVRTRIDAEAEAGRISRYAVPERVLVVEAIDKTSVGKIDKKRLRARYA